MAPDEEIAYLEKVLSGDAQPNLSPLATIGRLTQLYLLAPDNPKHLARAAELVETAKFYMEEERIGAEDPLYPKIRHLEAMTLRYRSAGRSDVLGPKGNAAEIDREAWRISLDKAPREAILIAKEWGDWAWDRDLWDQAAEAYADTGRALRRFLLRQVGSSEERLAAMREARVGARCFYAYVQLKDLKNAVVELERVNDVIFAMQEQIADLERLRKVAPEAAAGVDAALAAQASLVQPHHNQFGLDAFGNLKPQAEEVRKAYDEAVAVARAVDGFSSFARPTNWKDITAAAAVHPVAYVAVTEKGLGIVIVKTESGERAQCVFMTHDVTLAMIVENTKPFIEAEFGHSGEDSQQALLDALLWLSVAVTMPLRQALENLGHGDKPFILVPLGILSYLPIHAGCIIRPDNRLKFLFHPRDVAFGYRARNLIQSFRRKTERVSEGALVISNPLPLPPEFDSLSLSEYETEVALRHVRGHALVGEQATTGAVTSGLAKATLAHFSCHGFVDKRIDYSGTLLLANGEILTYQHLRDLKRIEARLVVLSACRTASTALRVETIVSLPSAFLAAGAAAVIGTFWHAEETATLLLMTRFYDLWRGGDVEPRQALGEAQAWLMFTRADELRRTLPAEALKAPAAAALRQAAADEMPYWHPWYWAGFFLAGA
jgi:CHAT domain-containing protein